MAVAVVGLSVWVVIARNDGLYVGAMDRVAVGASMDGMAVKDRLDSEGEVNGESADMAVGVAFGEESGMTVGAVDDKRVEGGSAIGIVLGA